MRNDRLMISNSINGIAQNADVLYTTLSVIRNDFDQTDLPPVLISNQEWHIPSSQLTSLPRNNDQFQQIATRLNLEQQKITNIRKIENIMWSVQYSMAKTRLHDSQGSAPEEKEVFYGCPPALAHDILQHGFNLRNHCIHGKYNDN